MRRDGLTGPHEWNRMAEKYFNVSHSSIESHGASPQVLSHEAQSILREEGLGEYIEGIR